MLASIFVRFTPLRHSVSFPELIWCKSSYHSFTSSSSTDRKELAKFAALASTWWDPNGPFGALHRLNIARCQFIRGAAVDYFKLDSSDPKPFQNLSFIDVGCGGGILSENIARLGGSVHGIDVVEENVRVASSHATLDPLLSTSLRYQCISAEDVLNEGKKYDIVLASEVLEHVKRPHLFVKTIADLCQPGGLVIISTLNRTLQSYALGIVAAEWLLGLVPRGTHTWEKFITPQELTIMGKNAGLDLLMMQGMHLEWPIGTSVLSSDVHVNYIASFSRKSEIVVQTSKQE